MSGLSRNFREFISHIAAAKFFAMGDFAIAIWMVTELVDCSHALGGTLLIFGIVFLCCDAFHKFFSDEYFDVFRKRIWVLISVGAVCFFVMGEYQIFKNRVYSHIKVVLYSSAAPNTEFSLSKELLKSASFWQLKPKQVDAPFIIIPLPQGATNVDLRFSAINDRSSFFESANEDDFIAEYPRMSVTIISSMEASKNFPAWHFAPDWKVRDNAAHFNFPSLLPGAGEDAPPIAFDVPQRPDPVVASLTIRCKQMPIETFNFHILFIHSASSSTTNFDPILNTNKNVIVVDQRL